ncbi:hypothetical protein FisN_9Lh143 [Fistulifera solaris]|uniref:Uncharacterized protein n=1 Tax=Fistulifera solaris TaxID=1519565 RepID=A0A1Z5KKZ0_FISSO|nr:hypothetical protein FisN_9Lh143 [Fistulifera solaris]|eukprot:GAX26857.1 hypothetical protein FisN_9Lh143 [Fistulifera solaris]
MTYSIKRLREEGHFRLRNMDGVDSLDVFWAEALKVKRLYIEDTGVYVAPRNTKKSEGEFAGLKCHHNEDYSTELQFVGKPDDIPSLRFVTFRVLCLPETDNLKTMSFSKNSYAPGRPLNERDQLILTPVQMRHIICAYPSRTFKFSYLSFNGDQSVELVSHRKFQIELFDCRFLDKGREIVEWLENRNMVEIFDYFDFYYCDCFEKILTFLSRSTHPVFKRLYANEVDVPSRLSHLVAGANVTALIVNIRFFIYDEGWRAPILQAICDGTFRPQSLEIQFRCAPIHGDYSREERQAIGRFLSKLFKIMSFGNCSLKELHLHDFNVRGIMQDFKADLADMLQDNRSLHVLGIYSTARPLKLPQITILHAAAKHPRLRKICFYPPMNDAPRSVDIDFIQFWLKENLSRNIQFKDFGYSDLRAHLPIWQKIVLSAFTEDFDALRQVENERFRSHLLVMALATFRHMPDRIYYLLTGNQDLIAK